MIVTITLPTDDKVVAAEARRSFDGRGVDSITDNDGVGVKKHGS